VYKLTSSLTVFTLSFLLLFVLIGCSKTEPISVKPSVSGTHSTTVQTKLVSGGVQGTIQWGINGHPGMQEAYKGTCNGFHVTGSTAQEGISVETQLDLVKSSGATWYRIDFPEKFYKDVAGKAFLKCVVDSASTRGIKILAVLKPNWVCAPPMTVCNKMRETAGLFANAVASDPAFQSKISAWELENELDVLSIIAGSYGTSPQDYPYFSRVFEVIKLLLDGITSVLPNAITIVDFAEMHYGFITKLKSELDLTNSWSKLSTIGWHIYDVLDKECFNESPCFDFKSIKDKLLGSQKPIWITEANSRNGSLKININLTETISDEKERIAIQKAAKKALASKDIAALFIYELFNEPYFAPEEANYGLYNVVKISPSANWNLGLAKPAVSEFRTVVNHSSSINSFVQAFYTGGLGRNSDGIGFMSYSGILRDAYGIDNTTMLNAARSVGNTIFTSNEYAARLRSNRNYVFDLYAAYNHRIPDTSGWDFWTSRVATVGRDLVRSEISTQTEFLNIVSQMSPQ
jgi:hypothetical protein